MLPKRCYIRGAAPRPPPIKSEGLAIHGGLCNSNFAGLIEDKKFTQQHTAAIFTIDHNHLFRLIPTLLPCLFLNLFLNCSNRQTDTSTLSVHYNYSAYR